MVREMGYYGYNYSSQGSGKMRYFSFGGSLNVDMTVPQAEAFFEHLDQTVREYFTQHGIEFSDDIHLEDEHV